MSSISNSHPFDNLIRSTRDLHARFGTAQTVRAAIRIAEEEWRETKHEAMSIAAGGLEGGNDQRQLSLEAADLFVTVIGLCDLCGVTTAQLKSAMQEVANKNDAKIPGETHMINPVTRKIQPTYKAMLVRRRKS
jgi:hypothetical protein